MGDGRSKPRRQRRVAENKGRSKQPDGDGIIDVEFVEQQPVRDLAVRSRDLGAVEVLPKEQDVIDAVEVTVWDDLWTITLRHGVQALNDWARAVQSGDYDPDYDEDDDG